MTVAAEVNGHAVVLRPKGELVEDTIDAFRSAVRQHLASKEVIDVVLDLENVPFMDSAALECLLELQEQLNDKLGRVKLARGDENIRKILEITRLEGSFELFDDVGEAVRAIQV